MAKKNCGICGRELGPWDNKHIVKNGVICYPCFNKGNFYGGANQAHMNKFLNNQTIAEVKELINDPVKLEAIKRKVAPVSHRFHQPIAQCSFCGKDIYKVDEPLKFKDSTYICMDCAAKNKAAKAHGWASEHTIDDFKKYINQGKDFSDISLEIDKQNEKQESKSQDKTNKCGICGKELGFWSIEHPIKDGVICDSCFEKGNFYKDTDPKKIREFLQTKTATEIQSLINNLEELQNVKKKVAPTPKKHSFPPIAKCSLCDQDIYRSDFSLKFKDSSYICADCRYKYKFSAINKPINWASKHTINDLKLYIDQGKDFTDIEFDMDQQRQKEQAEKEHQKQIKQAEKEHQKQIKQAEKEHQKQIKQAAKQKRKQEQAELKAESVWYGAYRFNLKKKKIYTNTAFHGLEFRADADDIVSYHVNEKGHDRTKHHTITRAAVGAIIAGTPGAIIAGTTGGKMNEYIDELGVIINLADGSSIDVELLNAKDNKADGFFVRHAYSDLNHVIAILDSWQAQKPESPAAPTDVPTEIRRYKNLLDDHLITQEEYDAKKKQLLDL
ncbi:DUF4428 domain-containing protein [Lactobacillus sp. ESL0785]|uniref:DUF4428 domain-containing protein n=1 Tax=Lactobacillus sp. ESL0785 TaxID=2983232 RepID=UPI0023F81D3A|nr:DUF4428 domain-containing protein [Lactobacillus sp. ESL0785]WEV71462.1 DUF4428 domain-containing protein [Lactobacillus sp. ESL0785]